MKDRPSDSRKVFEIGMWVLLRGAVVAVAYTLLKLGQYAVRFV